MITTNTVKQDLVERALVLLDEINFKRLKLRLQDPEEGPAWTQEQCSIAEQNYKCFMALKFAYPDEEIIPNQAVDTFWHYHIQDTQAYAKFCERIFGYFIHHYPYLDMRGEQEMKNWHLAFVDTAALYLNHFGRGQQLQAVGQR